MTAVTVFAALSAVMDEVRAVSKLERNTIQNFNFRGIDAVMNAVGPALRKHGVVVVPNVTGYEHKVVTVGKEGRPMGHVIVEVTYRFHGPAGDHIDAAVIGEAFDAGDKAVAKAMSVAFRTCLLQSLCLPTDEPDPDAATYERADAEHKALAKEVQRVDRSKVERVKTPDPAAENPWHEPFNLPDPGPSEGQKTYMDAEPVTSRQLAKIGALMAKCRLTDHDEAIKYVNTVLDLPEGTIQSRKDLSKGQASRLIDELGRAAEVVASADRG